MPPLAGIISVGDDNDIKLIEDLVKSSIQGNCLILLAISTKEDLETQKAVKLASEADPKGQRTIGVLTKPDTIEPGTHQKWLDLLKLDAKGQRYANAKTYFSTKQPSASDRASNLSIEAARSSEKAFFTTTHPWLTLPLAVKERLGTEKLVKHLSTELIQLIKKSLPGIRSIIDERLKTVNAELLSLPPPPSQHPVSELHSIIRAFNTDVARLTSANPAVRELVQKKNQAAATYATAIRRTKPFFRIKSTTPAVARSSSASDVSGDSDDSDDSDFSRSHNVVTPGTDANGEEEGLQEEEGRLCTDIEEVSALVSSFRADELPLIVPYEAVLELIARSLSHWDILTHGCLEELREPTVSAIDKIVAKHFGRYEDSGLLSVILETVHMGLQQLFSTCRQRLDDILELERAPYTQNDHYYVKNFDDSMKEFNQRFYSHDASLKGAKKANVVAETLAGLARLGYRGFDEQSLYLLHAKDESARSLTVMAHVAASWKVAYKRIVDNVPSTINAVVLWRMADTLAQQITASIGKAGPDEAARLMLESQSISEERKRLTLDKERLEGGRAEYTKLATGL